MINVFFNKKNYCFWVLAGIFALFCINLDGGRPFANPDEGRYVEIPREMVESGDYITPRLNAMKYFEKPPLMYWIQSAVIKYIGMDEQSMRFSIALFAFLGVLVLYVLMRNNTDQKTALYSSVILAISPLYYFLSRLIILDMPLTAFISLAYFCFYQAISTGDRLHKRLWYYGLSTALGLGILTKGIVILAVTGPVFVIWLTLTKNWKNLLPLYLPTVILLFLAIVVPWHYFAYKANPDFLNKYFYVEHFLRYTTSVHGRYKPFWFFIPFVALGLLPWTFIALKGIQEGLKKYKPLTLYLVLWASWTVGFYSIGNSKLIPYILPALIPLAGLAGMGLAQIINNEKRHWTLTLGMILLLVLGIAGVLLTYINFDFLKGNEDILPPVGLMSIFFIVSSILCLASQYGEKIDSALDETIQSPSTHALSEDTVESAMKNRDTSMAVHSAPTYEPQVGLFFIGGIASLILKNFNRRLFVLFLCSIALIVLTNFIAPTIQKTSVKPFAEIINAEKRVGDTIVSLDSYFQDLPVYTKTAPITCVDAISELEYGMDTEAPKTHEWMLTKGRFIKEFGPASGKPFWAVARRPSYDNFKSMVPSWKLKIRAENKELVLFYHSGK